MKFIRNASWTARIIAVLVMLGVVFGTVAAMPIFEAMEWMVGTRGLALMAAAYALFVLVLFFPAWWPWWQARRARLEDRWCFVVIVWGVAVGGVEALLAAVFVPLAVFVIFFVPQFQEMKMMSDGAGFLHFVMEYWWVCVPVLHGIASVYTTRFLAHRWHAVRMAWSPAP